MKDTWILYLITKIDENPRVVLVQRQKTFGAIRGIIAPDFSQAQIVRTMNESDDQGVSLEQRLGNWRNGNNVGADYRDTARWDENYAKLSRFKAYREQAAAETNDRFER